MRIGIAPRSSGSRAAIEWFGCFPHRNAVLGRVSTPEELAFLEEPESQLDLLKVKRPEGEPLCR